MNNKTAIFFLSAASNGPSNKIRDEKHSCDSRRPTIETSLLSNPSRLHLTSPAVSISVRHQLCLCCRSVAHSKNFF